MLFYDGRTALIFSGERKQTKPTLPFTYNRHNKSNTHTHMHTTLTVNELCPWSKVQPLSSRSACKQKDKVLEKSQTFKVNGSSLLLYSFSCWWPSQTTRTHTLSTVWLKAGVWLLTVETEKPSMADGFVCRFFPSSPTSSSDLLALSLSRLSWPHVCSLCLRERKSEWVFCLFDWTSACENKMNPHTHVCVCQNNVDDRFTNWPWIVNLRFSGKFFSSISYTWSVRAPSFLMRETRLCFRSNQSPMSDRTRAISVCTLVDEIWRPDLHNWLFSRPIILFALSDEDSRAFVCRQITLMI